jgi:hypothetical protein
MFYYLHIYLHFEVEVPWSLYSSHRGIDVDHGINVEQHSKPRSKCILFLHLFRGFES